MKNKKEIVVPLELFEGHFNLMEIGAVCVLLASPHLEPAPMHKWGEDEELGKIVNKFVDEGVVSFVEDENRNKFTTIDLERKNMKVNETVTVEGAIRDLAKNHGYLEDDLKIIRSYMEDIAFSAYSYGYTDGEIDSSEKNFQAYGKKEDF